MTPDRSIIVALATAPGRGGVAVLRVSGPSLQAMAFALAGVQASPRHAHLVAFRDQAGQVLDRGLLIWFPAPASYTGEDVLELHTHGGDVLPRRVLQACLDLGARLAQPGEFTRRAFLRGKLDLVQAEAVADLIEASSEAAARGALRSLDGEFSRSIRDIQQDLHTARVQLEGSLDFPEEELAVAPVDQVRQMLRPMVSRLRELLSQGLRGQALRAGRQVVLYGPPNVGKSSLLNRLAGEDLAIVSAEAGTTRDTIRTHLELGGLRLELIDTAGVRDGAQAVEKLGIARAQQAAAQADLVLVLRAFDQPSASPAEDAAMLTLPATMPVLYVWNKRDLASSDQLESLAQQDAVCLVSAQTGEGVAALERRILSALGWSAGTEPGFLARTRHLDALRSALGHLEQAERAVQEELVAEDLRLAQGALNEILGEFVADDLLGEIFSRFCIGK